MQQFVPEHKLLSRLADNTAVTLTGRTSHVTVRKKAISLQYLRQRRPIPA